MGKQHLQFMDFIYNNKSLCLFNTLKPEIYSDKICKFDSHETRYFVSVTKTNILFFVQENNSRLFWPACEKINTPLRENAVLCRIAINPLKTKRRLLYIKTQFALVVKTNQFTL